MRPEWAARTGDEPSGAEDRKQRQPVSAWHEDGGQADFILDKAVQRRAPVWSQDVKDTYWLPSVKRVGYWSVNAKDTLICYYYFSFFLSIQNIILFQTVTWISSP